MKEQLISELNEFLEFIGWIEDINDEIWFAPLGEGKWRIHDVVTHIMRWDMYFNKVTFPASIESQSPELAEHPDYLGYNEQSIRYGQDKTKQQIIDETKRNRQLMIDQVNSLDEDQFSGGYPGEREFTLASYLTRFFTSHDKHHMRQIRDFIASRLMIESLSPSDEISACRVFETSIPDAFAKEGLGDLQEDIQSEVDYKKQMLRASLDQACSDTFFLVAKMGQQIVGTISFGPCGEDAKACTNNELSGIGELGSLYILPGYQGMGIGSALIRDIANLLKRQGVERFCLDSGYRRAQKRWQQKFGQPYAVVKDYWGPGSVHMVWVCSVSDFADVPST
ncbi:GNAT family N-acetyltransferase [Paenibacillus puldeungensis]|uniref:GNAT family N-acetyltransferase n=1 Tax=Paenibacillus puldeungensis TaxID=696536 RepID=A0ABW3RZN2_9BACL